MTTYVMRVFVCALVAALVRSAPAGEPAHPSLLLTPAGVAELRDRVAGADFARAQFDAIRKRVDASLARPVELPPRGSNWFHWYVCPKHGNRLTTGKSIGKWRWEHVCPVDGEVFRGDPSDVKTDFDGCRLATVNGDYAATVRDAGLVYQVTRDRRYADRARDILLAYANTYADYPLHTINNEPKIGGGKVGAQTLDESVWLIPMAQGADLVWDALSPDDRRTLADKLFLPAARDVILPHKLGVHNIQCWKNSAVGLVGFLLDDAELVRAAIDDADRGYRTQVAKGVSKDGQWWEGAWGYHFYTAQACWPLVEAARNHGVDLYTADYKRLFDGPLNFAMPNLVLPDFSDSHEVNIAGHASLYELAYARYREPKYVPLIEKGGRDNSMAMLFGVTPLPAAAATESKSANYPDTGYAILRAAPKAGGPPDRDTWLCLKYGPHGGGHGHPDKLSLVLYANGRVLAPDAGITSYGTPLHQGWYRTTIAHSTLTVDQANQKATTGTCIDFGRTPDRKRLEYLVADAGAIYPGVRFTRTVTLLSENEVLIVDQVRSDREHTYDLALHLRGRFAAGVDRGAPWKPPEKPGYKYLTDARVRDIGGEDFAVSVDGAANVSIASAGQARLISATGPGASTADRVPLLIVRTVGKEACVAWHVSFPGTKNASRHLKIAAAETSEGKLPASRAAWVLVKGGTPATLPILANPDGERVRLFSEPFVTRGTVFDEVGLSKEADAVPFWKQQ